MMSHEGGGFVSISSTAALNDLALGNLIDTGQTGRPDFKRAPAALLLLLRRHPFLCPLSPLPSFVQVVGHCLGVHLSRWTERRWRGGRSGSDPVYQGIVGGWGRGGKGWGGGGRRRGRSNSESVRTIIWRWQRDGQDERSTSPSTLMSSRRSFSFFVFACLRTFANARHTGLVLNTARFHGRNICPSPSRGVKHANFGVS